MTPRPGTHNVGVTVKLMPSEPLVKLFQLRITRRASSENASVTIAKYNSRSLKRKQIAPITIETSVTNATPTIMPSQNDTPQCCIDRYVAYADRANAAAWKRESWPGKANVRVKLIAGLRRMNVKIRIVS